MILSNPQSERRYTIKTHILGSLITSPAPLLPYIRWPHIVPAARRRNEKTELLILTKPVTPLLCCRIANCKPDLWTRRPKNVLARPPKTIFLEVDTKRKNRWIKSFIYFYFYFFLFLSLTELDTFWHLLKQADTLHAWMSFYVRYLSECLCIASH